MGVKCLKTVPLSRWEKLFEFSAHWGRLFEKVSVVVNREGMQVQLGKLEFILSNQYFK